MSMFQVGDLKTMDEILLMVSQYRVNIILTCLNVITDEMLFSIENFLLAKVKVVKNSYKHCTWSNESTQSVLFEPHNLVK